MIKRFVFVLAFTLCFQANNSIAGETGSEEMSSKNTTNTEECFEGASRSIFKFNQGLDKVIFKPVAKGYRKLPLPVRKGTNNFVSNLSSLLTLPNNLLQGNLSGAGNTVGRFLMNSTVGVFGIFDPAASLGAEKKPREDFGQTFGVWGMDSGCYFVLPALGPTTARDFVGKIGDTILDPVYMVTKGDQTFFDRSYSEHNYYYYKGTDAVDFRAKNLESFDSLEKNSIDIYASVKSLYLQNRNKNIGNSSEQTSTHDDSDWEEIDIK